MNQPKIDGQCSLEKQKGQEQRCSARERKKGQERMALNRRKSHASPGLY